MPKKTPRNSYYYFMLDFQARELRKGRNLSIVQASVQAGPEWSKMSANARKPYEEKAKREKSGKKYTSQGEDVEVVIRREQTAKEQIDKMKKHIESLMMVKDISKLEFFVVEVNYYCFCTALQRFLPAEISIVRFSLREGVDLDDIYHIILDIGELPIGYRLTADNYSKEIHQIPTPPHDDQMNEISERDIEKAFKSMIRFLRKNVDHSEPTPPLYVDDSVLHPVQNIFDHLELTYGEDRHTLKLYSLPYLFYQLRNAAQPGSLRETLAQDAFNNDIYELTMGIACKFHNTTEVFHQCSLSKCIRKVFIICDHTNKLLNIPLIPGKHVPANANAERVALTGEELAKYDADEATNPWSTVSALKGLRLHVEEDQEKQKLKSKREQPRTRLPFSSSIVAEWGATRAPELSYEESFPALGGPPPGNKPSSIGRGRGRILNSK